MGDREMFIEWAKSNLGFWIDDGEIPVLIYVDGGCHPAERDELALWNALQAARRTTPDREAVIEECAKVCERVAVARSVVEMNVGAQLCADAIRALKTATTSDKGGA